MNLTRWEPPVPPQHRQSITESNKRSERNIISMLRKLRSMDPLDFERLIAKIWEVQGYATNVRSSSRDKGIDVEAVKEDAFSRNIQLIQAKRYGSSNKVGSEEIRKYSTLYQQVPKADQIVVVTSSKFTAPAKELARDLDVKIINGEELSNLIKQANISIPAPSNRKKPQHPSERRGSKLEQGETESAESSITKDLRKQPESTVGVDLHRRCPNCGANRLRWETHASKWINNNCIICQSCNDKFEYNGGDLRELTSKIGL